MNKISAGLKTLFLVHFVVGLIFGLLELFIPDVYLGWFGVPAPDVLPYRFLGAALLAFALSSWLCYQAAEWEKVKIVVQTEIVWTVLGALAGLYMLLFAAAPAAVWINVIILGGFAAAFIYYYLKK